MDSFEELMQVQRQMASRIVQESETDRKLQMMDIINDLVTDKNKKIQTEKVILEAQAEGMSESVAIQVIEELIDLGFLIEVSQGFLKRG